MGASTGCALAIEQLDLLFDSAAGLVEARSGCLSNRDDSVYFSVNFKNNLCIFFLLI